VDLGIAGKNALVCASSEGLGKACAKSLAREGANVVLNGRTQVKLNQAADEVAEVANRSASATTQDVDFRDPGIFHRDSFANAP